MYNAKIILDSISHAGSRLTTFEIEYPRFIHAEFLTHRMFSRNSASSRAIPVEKIIAKIKSDPAIPVYWGKNQKGMQANEELSDLNKIKAMEVWLRLRDQAIAGAIELQEIGVHKQIANRVSEPWMFITVIVSATNFDNFFHLRDHWQAQPEIQYLAKLMKKEYINSVPIERSDGEWHLPYIDSYDCDIINRYNIDVLKKISVGRVARVSYLTHDGIRNIDADIELHDRLLQGLVTGDPLHMSPFEHIAVALGDKNAQSGNFNGWGQYRKDIVGECHYNKRSAKP